MKTYVILALVTIFNACGGMSSQKEVTETDVSTPKPAPEVCGPTDQTVTSSTGGNWQLVWADEFNGSVVDAGKWQHEVNCAGGGNNELQCYQDDQANAFVENGHLHIVALNQAVTGDEGWDGDSGVMVSRDYSSARLRTLSLGDWKYGRFEIRAKLPYGQGIWPAIWMMPSESVYGNWPSSGEIDIMEAVNLRTDTNDNNRVYSTLHFTDKNGQLKSSGDSIVPTTDMTTEFHNYVAEWEAGEIRWYIDDQLLFSQHQTDWMTCGGGVKENFEKTDSAPFDQNFHLILNLAVGGDWPGSPDTKTVWPQEMLVDYVRVYQCDSDAANGMGCATKYLAEKPKVVGYIPSYKGITSSIKNANLSKLTHLNLSFVNPDANGNLITNDQLLCMPSLTTDNVNGDEIRTAVEHAHQAGVKVLISIAGGVIPSCSGDWYALLQPEIRQDLVNKLVKLVVDFNLDGLDIDLEGVLLTQIDNAGNYTPFIQALSSELKKSGKLLTSATASYEGGMIPVSSIPYFDFVNIMSYDAIGPSWGVDGAEHSTYQQAIDHIELWKQRGLSKEKLVLGVPFYGYGFGSYAANYNFKDILSEFGQQAAENDVLGNACANCDYVTYNGLNTIKAKTRLALEQGTGVMIWEITQDTKNQNSLLNAIVQEMEMIASEVD